MLVRTLPLAALEGFTAVEYFGCDVFQRNGVYLGKLMGCLDELRYFVVLKSDGTLEYYNSVDEWEYSHTAFVVQKIDLS